MYRDCACEVAIRLTYFRTATTVLEYRHLQLIVRPERDGSLTTLCVFSFEPIPRSP